MKGLTVKVHSMDDDAQDDTLEAVTDMTSKERIACAKLRLAGVKGRLANAAKSVERSPEDVTLIAVSKTFDPDAIRPLIAAGQFVFGENRIQEAQRKWPAVLSESPNVELHLIGPLQSNKTRDAVALFDVIHTIDRPKIAHAIATECARTDRQPKVFVQVNTGEEPQKAGVFPQDLTPLVELVRNELGLNLAGLMCIPPVDDEPAIHFAFLAKLAKELGLNGLSMGMSADFETAIQFGATHIRVGSAIFGQRTTSGTAVG